MAEFQYKLDVIDKVINELSKLSKKLQRKTAVNVARRAMVPVRDAAKANAQKLDYLKTKIRYTETSQSSSTPEWGAE